MAAVVVVAAVALALFLNPSGSPRSCSGRLGALLTGNQRRSRVFLGSASGGVLLSVLVWKGRRWVGVPWLPGQCGLTLGAIGGHKAGWGELRGSSTVKGAIVFWEVGKTLRFPERAI